MEGKGDNINISSLPVAPDSIRVQLEQVEVTSSDITLLTSSDKPAFGPRPNVQVADFDFEVEINYLPLS